MRLQNKRKYFLPNMYEIRWGFVDKVGEYKHPSSQSNSFVNNFIENPQTYTMFRQAILLSQYSFICVQYFNCSDIRNIFRQLVNKTADCFKNIVFILVMKISPKNVCEKMENNSTLEKVLQVCNRNAELLRLIGTTFDFEVASLRRRRKKNLIILKSLSFLFYFFVVVDT